MTNDNLESILIFFLHFLLYFFFAFKKMIYFPFQKKFSSNLWTSYETSSRKTLVVRYVQQTNYNCIIFHKLNFSFLLSLTHSALNVMKWNACSIKSFVCRDDFQLCIMIILYDYFSSKKNFLDKIIIIKWRYEAKQFDTETAALTNQVIM